MTQEQILKALSFFLNTTYFMYRGKFYKQKHGVAMGSPVSLIVANLYMEHFEQRALATASYPPKMQAVENHTTTRPSQVKSNITNSMPSYHFLYMINSNHMPNMHRFQDAGC
jgi:hypothetical protein